MARLSGTIVERPLGVTEQRDFLLRQAEAEAVLYLDDDVLMEPWVLERLLAVLRVERCGFVGAFPVQLSYLEDVRPEQQRVEFWNGRVTPEVVQLGSPAWGRADLHRAANLFHASQSNPDHRHTPLQSGLGRILRLV